MVTRPQTLLLPPAMRLKYSLRSRWNGHLGTNSNGLLFEGQSVDIVAAYVAQD
jgi:hypothetical protein